jgi:hypothetical protein
METRIQKSCYGTWMAETIMPLNDKLHLCLTTMKRSDGNITTTVTQAKKKVIFLSMTHLQITKRRFYHHPNDALNPQ